MILVLYINFMVFVRMFCENKLKILHTNWDKIWTKFYFWAFWFAFLLSFLFGFSLGR